jgi:hypothetical protein
MSLPQKTLFITIIFAIVINLLQFKEEVLRRSDTADILMLALRKDNVWDTHNLYATLGRIAPGVTVSIPAEKGFRRGSEFMARLLGLSRIKLKRRAWTGDFSDLSDFIVAKGTVWNNPADSRKGRPGSSWAIAISQSRPQELILTSNQDFLYFFVDVALIPKLQNYRQ